MQKLLSKAALLSLIFFVASCADYKLHIAPEAKDWKKETPDTEMPVTHTMYLVGDAGNAPLGGTKPALTLLKSFLDTANLNSSVIFLGDNIYPVGMPPRSVESYREIAEHRLNAQIETVKNFAGRPIFLPGNHDWGRYGKKGVIRQEKYVESELEKIYGDKFDSDDFFLPNDGCSGPEVIEINDQLVVIVIDSNWFVMDWDKHPNVNDECEIKNREVFKFLFNDEVRKHRSKNAVIALHHPIYTNGTHGGKFTLKQHLFPLTEKSDNLWIPFPGIGSIAQFVRANTGMRQDNSHGIYQDMIEAVVTPAKRNGEYIFASGHEHSIQYFENDDQKFIVSGAGSKQTPTALGNGALMTYGHYGFAKLDFYEDGSAWLEYYIPNEDGSAGEMIFRRKIKGELEISEDNIPDEYPTYKDGKEVVSATPITTETEKVGPVHKAVLGEHWRDIYRAEYDFPVLDLDTFAGGGVKVLKRGGGNQTNSLRLEDTQGREWTMRALTKDASRFIPYPFNQLNAAKFIVRDNFLSAHPFAAVIIPPLAEAANIYHTNPKLYYIPKQPVLGVHNDLFGNQVYLVEERPMDEWKNQETFGNPDDVEGTYDVAEKIKKGYDHRVDQVWTVRTRLFDFLIGDWDRHDDQWRWTQLEEGKMDYYRPIPRDRDQALSKYDGAATAIARLYAPFLRQLVTYKEDLGNVKWATWSPRHFDAAFLNELTLDQWLEQAKYIQENVTDEVIEEAFKIMPEPAYSYSAPELIKTMKGRRDNLQDIARKVYHHLSRRVTVIGSDKADYFEVIRQDKDHTLVRIYDRDKDGGKDEYMYERLFDHEDTEEIFLYGLNGDDVFYVKGDVKKGIKVNLIGGLDEDEFNDSSKVGGWGKKTVIYDNLQENELNGGKETLDKRSVQAEENTYVRRGPQYEKNILMPSPILGYNPDDGFLAGLGLQYTTFAFGKPVFASRHTFKGDYAFATSGFNLRYGGEFFDAFKRFDVVMNARGTNSRYAINYFGFGNETKYDPDAVDLDFNRVRQSNYYFDIGLRKRFLGKLGSISLRPLIDITKIERTPGRFITSDDSDVAADAFERQYYFGGILEFNFRNVNNNASPTKGMHFHFDYEAQTSLNTGRAFNTYNAFWTMYIPISNKANPVIATRLGIQTVAGDYRFFQAPTIGGAGRGGVGDLSTLRGYRAERFRGESVFYHNIDLRAKLFKSRNSILPFSLGIHGGFDYGRVYTRDEDSSTWHTGYGGGIFLAPIDFFVITFGSYHSKEDSRFVVRLGQSF